MKDTETVTLEQIAEQFAQGMEVAAEKYYEEAITENKYYALVENSKDEAKAAIIKLFEQAVESAKPPHWETPERRSEPSDRQIGYNEGIDEYQQNLLQALSNSGKQHIDRGVGFTHSDSNDCACLSSDAKEDLL